MKVAHGPCPIFDRTQWIANLVVASTFLHLAQGEPRSYAPNVMYPSTRSSHLICFRDGAHLRAQHRWRLSRIRRHYNRSIPVYVSVLTRQVNTFCMTTLHTSQSLTVVIQKRKGLLWKRRKRSSMGTCGMRASRLSPVIPRP